MSMESTKFTPNVCVVDDDPIMGESLRKRLIHEVFGVDLYDRAHKAYERILRRRKRSRRALLT